ncbi:MAG: hypothetical protein PHD15_06315 [Clostridia bacterium]|nr:hypothetical protein [Clostridia bacterium]MDD4387344.1 hypothetical protein [Clostridia bacterium]
MINENKKRIQITLDKDVLTKLEQLANNDNRTISNYINNLIVNKEEV